MQSYKSHFMSNLWLFSGGRRLRHFTHAKALINNDLAWSPIALFPHLSPPPQCERELRGLPGPAGDRLGVWPQPDRAYRLTTGPVLSRSDIDFGGEPFSRPLTPHVKAGMAGQPHQQRAVIVSQQLVGRPRGR